MIDLTKDRHGKTVDGREISYYSRESMALPAEIVEERNGMRETTRYDSRWYALAVFAQETDNKALLTQVQAEEPCDCGECLDELDKQNEYNEAQGE